MTISLRAVGATTAAAGAVTGVTAGVPAGLTATDISILTVEIKGQTAGVAPTITTPSGWTLIGTVTNNGTLVNNVDTGSNTVGMYYRIGTYTAPTITTSDANSMGAGIVAYAGTVGDWDVTGTTTGSDTSSGTNASITGAANLSATTGDWVIAGVGLSGDVGSVTAETLAATGATIGTRANRINLGTTTNADSRLVVTDWPVTAGTSTAAPVYTYTNTSATTSHARFVRLREVALPPPSAPSDAYGQAVFNDTPVAWYRANGSTADYMQGTAGTLTGGTYGSGIVPTVTSQSFDLDGVDDYVNIPDQPKLSFGAPITVEAWFQADTLTGAGAIVSRESATTAEEFELYHNGTTLQWWIRGITTCTFEIATGTAYHVVATWDGSTARMYVNNVAATAVAATMTVPVFDGNLRIGSWNGSSEFLDGRVSEVAIYDRVLTSTEAGEHYTAGTTSGGSTVTGSGALAASATTLAGAGTVTVTGSGAATASAAALSGAGTVRLTGSGALAPSAPAISGVGALRISGAGALAPSAPALSGAAAIRVTGSGALAPQAATAAGAGTLRISGAGALAPAAGDLSGAGTITPVGVGTGALNPQAATIAGTGTLRLSGTGALAPSPAALSGSGSSTIEGAGTLEAQPASLSGLGELSVVGAAELTAQAATLAGAALVGADTLTLDPLTTPVHGAFTGDGVTVGTFADHAHAATFTGDGVTHSAFVSNGVGVGSFA